MEHDDMNQKKAVFLDALEGKNIPILTLDHKWYRLLDETGKEDAKELENQLNELLKRQGRLNTDSKDIKKIKKKLMSEIVTMADEARQNADSEIEGKIEEHKRLIEECNEKLEDYQDELLDIPREIEAVNSKLMLMTMECCYREMQQNTEEITEIENWVTEIRIELKKRLINKQGLEHKNHEIYSYMHDIFGAEVLDMFDMKYNPEKKHPTV